MNISRNYRVLVDRNSLPSNPIVFVDASFSVQTCPFGKIAKKIKKKKTKKKKKNEKKKKRRVCAHLHVSDVYVASCRINLCEKSSGERGANELAGRTFGDKPELETG
ncbi:hypothetical protein PUN28_007137 [Cardiocondyla obscurior]|uniref:Uncharacterized protein n=1 Tax=Cardiocondyla obscurior TaxID=286306 RepID=A0AAW2G4N6_9HYME